MPVLLELGEEVTVSLEEGPVPGAGAAQAVCWEEFGQDGHVLGCPFPCPPGLQSLQELLRHSILGSHSSLLSENIPHCERTWKSRHPLKPGRSINLAQTFGDQLTEF